MPTDRVVHGKSIRESATTDSLLIGGVVKRSRLAISIIVLSASQFASAQVFQQIESAVERSEYAALYQTIDSECGIVDEAQKVEKSLDQAIERRRCIERSQGAALAASTFEQREGIERLTATLVEQAKAHEEEEKSERKFLGLNWGLGFGYSFSFDDAIDDAAIVDGVVRVNSSREQEPRVLLEFHRYFWCNEAGTDGTKGCGPFIAAAAKDDDVLGGVAMGFMYGRKVKVADSEGFSVGIGALLDADVRDLGDGFAVNQPPPGNETAVRFETKARWAAVLFVSRTF